MADPPAQRWTAPGGAREPTVPLVPPRAPADGAPPSPAPPSPAQLPWSVPSPRSAAPPGWTPPPAAPPGRTPRRRPRSRPRRFAARVLLLALAVPLVFAVLIGSLRWWTPPRTAFMLEDGSAVTYRYVSLDHVSRYLLASVIAHEDEQLGTRSGAFSLSSLGSRAGAWLTGQPDPSGSTIPQQLAKNVFLWPHQDPLRKGVEAVLATEMAYELPDQRLLELYVNYAQFGPHLYGVCAASWYYFGEPPSSMTPYQAAQLMGVLPDPDRVERAAGGGIDLGPGADPLAVNLVNGAANVHVPREIAGMGGWQAAVATVGIHDTAGAHGAERGSPDACSTMPAAVAARIAAG